MKRRDPERVVPAFPGPPGTPAQLCINTIRTLAMDAVEQAHSRHPGTPMALAPVAYCLWQRFLRFDPDHPISPNRDRFVLSVGHASMLLYTLLHLAAYPGTVAFAIYLRRQGIKTAIVTSSQNCDVVLKSAHVDDLFDARVDGQVVAAQKLAGKPAPDSFLHAAKMLRVKPDRAVVVEDAISGVIAGARGGFRLVIGIDRKNNAHEMKAQGAHQSLSMTWQNF